MIHHHVINPTNCCYPFFCLNLLPTVSHSYGFGLMDAAAMVEKAETWHTVPEQHICNAKATGLPL